MRSGGERCSGKKRNDRWVIMVARIRETTFGCDMTFNVAVQQGQAVYQESWHYSHIREGLARSMTDVLALLLEREKKHGKFSSSVSFKCCT